MKLPNLQDEQFEVWSGDLRQLIPNNHKKHAKIIGFIDALNRHHAEFASTRSRQVDEAAIAQYLHYYLSLFVALFANLGGYELIKVKAKYKEIFLQMLAHLQAPEQDILWPAIKSIGMPTHSDKVRNFATVVGADIRSNPQPLLGMAFNPENNHLHFLSAIPMEDVSRGEAARAQNNANKNKRPLKIFNPSDIPEAEEVGAAGGTKKAVKKVVPGIVTDAPFPDGVTEDTVIDFSLQTIQNPEGKRFDWCYSLRDKSLKVASSDDSRSYDIASVPDSPFQRYVFHPRQPVVIVLHNNQRVDVKVSGHDGVKHRIDTTAFRCAVQQIVISPNGRSLVILLTNGSYRVYEITGEGIYHSEKIFMPVKKDFVPNVVQWLNNTDFVLLHSASGRRQLVTIAERRVIEYKKLLKDLAFSHVYHIPFNPRHTELAEKVEIDEGKATGLVVYYTKQNGVTLSLYRVEGSGADGAMIKYFRPSHSRIFKKFPLGLVMSPDNNFVAIRYSDGSIDVVSIVTLYPKASDLSIFKNATRSITPYGDYKGGFNAN